MATDSDVLAIVNLKKELEDRDSGRNDNYDEVLNAYGGSTYKERKKYGYWGGLVNKLTSVFNTRNEDEDLEVDTPINLIKPAIMAKVAFMGLPPMVSVPEPPMDDEDAAIEFSDRQEQAYLGHWKFSNMPRRCYDLAWFLGAFGGAVMGVWPDIRHGRPRIFVRSPQYFYPICYDEDGMELEKCLWVDTMPGYEVAAKWGVTKYAGETKDIEVIQYIDEEKMCVVIDNVMFAFDPVGNKTGKVPVVCIGNIGIPGSPFGDTDVAAAIPIAKEINYRMSLEDEQASAMIKPTIAIRDPMNVPDDIAIGQGGTITMGPNGSVELLGPIPVPKSFWESMDRLQNWYDMVADNPAALRSEGFGSILTGKGFNAMLSPLTARLQIRRSLIDPAIEQVNRHLMEMWWKFPKFAKKTKLSGVKGKDAFFIEAEPDEFVIDGKMWTENEVFLSSNAYVDRQGNVVEDMQLYQQELLSWDSTVEDLGKVQNKKREKRRIERDREWKAQGMAIANQLAQSPATANPELGEPEKTAYALERGFMGETPPPTGPEATMPAAPEGMPPEGMPPEMGGAPPAEPILEDVVQELRQIPKVKGRVFLAGAFLQDPTAETLQSAGLELFLTDMGDKATILNYVKKTIPEIDGNVKFYEGTPDEPSIEVTPGTEGIEPQGTPPEGMAGPAPGGAEASMMVPPGL